jgi:hypothetical protein
MSKTDFTAHGELCVMGCPKEEDLSKGILESVQNFMNAGHSLAEFYDDWR